MHPMPKEFVGHLTLNFSNDGLVYAADRAAIVRLCCRQVPIAADVDVMELARRTDGRTGADLETLCKKATLLAISEYQRGARDRPFVVQKRDFFTVLESAPSSEASS